MAARIVTGSARFCRFHRFHHRFASFPLSAEKQRLMSRTNTNSTTAGGDERLAVQPGGVAHLQDDVGRQRAHALQRVPSGIRGWLPAIIATAIVSPMARPMPRIIAGQSRRISPRAKARGRRFAHGWRPAPARLRNSSRGTARMAASVTLMIVGQNHNAPAAWQAVRMLLPLPPKTFRDRTARCTTSAEEAVDDRRDARQQVRPRASSTR